MLPPAGDLEMPERSNGNYRPLDYFWHDGQQRKNIVDSKFDPQAAIIWGTVSCELALVHAGRLRARSRTVRLATYLAHFATRHNLRQQGWLSSTLLCFLCGTA